jgi:lipoprotein-anchoring transpeptidase ErfK/SrfK
MCQDMMTQAARLFMTVWMIAPACAFAVAPSSRENNVMKPASQLIGSQNPGKVFPDALEKGTPETFRLVVSISKQRAYLMAGSKIAIDTPISSGRRHGWTPTGEFTIIEKDPNHYSSLYGEFIDSLGHTVRSGVSSRIESAPSSTQFRGAPMRYFMRITPQGVGLHAGILPGYPASHGCIRLPIDMAEIIYRYVSLQTPVSVVE